jgi:hypothetical protein
VNREKHAQQVAKGNHGRIERDLYHFRVTGGAGAYLPVARIRGRAARIPRLHSRHALQIAEDRIEAPKATATKGGGFGLLSFRHTLSP